MRVVFLGNHTVGVASLSTLIECAEVVGVVAHPEDPEDGCLYESVYEYSINKGLNAIRGKATESIIFDFIAANKPDLIWIADYRYLLPNHFLSIARLGAINLHPSLLPKYRGRAPINWAIINGETALGLTAHFIDEGMDSGDIIEQEKFNLSLNEDVGDALSKLLPLYSSVTCRVINNILAGNIIRYKQNSKDATYYPARKPEDGQIIWNQPANLVMNLIRAVAKPYPGAFTFLEGKKISIWKVRIPHSSVKGAPGLIIGFENESPIVCCGKGGLVLDYFECHDNNIHQIQIGNKLDSRG